MSGTESLPKNEADDADAADNEEGDAVSCTEKTRENQFLSRPEGSQNVVGGAVDVWGRGGEIRRRERRNEPSDQ